jgi:transcriptional regulator with XRE-family HTH domain
MKHWTQSTGDFTYNISMDFFTQLEDRMEEKDISRKELSSKLDVTPSAVSQILNTPPENPFVETLVQYARTLDLKVAIVSYDDDDPDNEKGPVYSGIFEKAWKRLGSPRDLSMFAENLVTANPTGLLISVGANEPNCDDFTAATKPLGFTQHKYAQNTIEGGQYDGQAKRA